MRVIDVNVPRPISAMMLSLKYNRLREKIPHRSIKQKKKNKGKREEKSTQTPTASECVYFTWENAFHGNCWYPAAWFCCVTYLAGVALSSGRTFHVLSLRWHCATHCKNRASSNRQCVTNLISWFDYSWCPALRDRANSWIDSVSMWSHCCRANRVISIYAMIAQTLPEYRKHFHLKYAIVRFVDWPDCWPMNPHPMSIYCDCSVRAMSIYPESTDNLWGN